MSYYFIDPTNGDDANDGRQCRALPSSSVDNFSPPGVALPAATYAVIEIGDMLELVQGVLAACYQVVGKEDMYVVGVTKLFGDTLTGGIETTLPGTGPVKTYARLTALALDSDMCFCRGANGAIRRVNREGTSDDIDPVTGENYKKVFPQGIQLAPGVDPFAALSLSEKQYKRVQAAQAENARRNDERRARASRQRRFFMP